VEVQIETLTYISGQIRDGQKIEKSRIFNFS